MRFTKKYDVIVMFDVIEHLKDPKGYLEKCHQLLKKDGIVAIETGNTGSFLARIQKSRWRLIQPPMHLQYFSRHSLDQLLINTGFKVLSNTHVGFHRSISQIIYRLTRKIIPISFSFPVNTYDLQFAIARKKSTSFRSVKK